MPGCPCERYTSAPEQMNQRQFDAAQSAFEALGEYKDSVGMLEECKYGKALALSQGGELETVCGLFRALGDYKDCQQQISQILK